MTRTKTLLRYNLPFLFIILLGFFVRNYSNIFTNTNFNDFYGKYIDQEAYDFSLKSPNGKEVRLSNFRGKFILLTFGFTKCTGVCPLNLQRFKKLSATLHNKPLPNTELNFIFISFDNIRDTPKEMQQFLANFKSPYIHGLLPGKDSGAFVATKYKNYVNVSKEEIIDNPEYQINHNGFLYLIDPNGHLALIYMQPKIDKKKIINDIKKLKIGLKERTERDGISII